MRPITLKKPERSWYQRMYWALRLWDEEQLGCTKCGDTIVGTNSKHIYIWVIPKTKEDASRNDEVDLYCERCWEKEE